MSALVGVVMGSQSDWDTMKHCVETLRHFGIPFEVHVYSAHRTPDAALAFAEQAAERGLKVIIAAAGGAAHLAGVLASKTILPVLAVPMVSDPLRGIDSLLSMVQMPSGIPVGTLAIGKAGAVNAALLAISILALNDANLARALVEFRRSQTQKVLEADAKAQRMEF
jgi:5-(carboxyamino)imidazole ribonucleotide mutase